MSRLSQVQYDLRHLDELSRRGIGFSRIHPVVQLIITLIFIIIAVSYDAGEITGLLPLILFPSTLFIVNEIPLKPILIRLAFGFPFIIGVGILNPIFDRQQILIGTMTLARGWLTFFSIVIKGVLTISAALLLLSSCGLPKLAKSLRILKVPKLIVLQLLLTYRYLTVLLEEVARTLTAYALRAPGQKGIGYKAWGSLAGQLLVRTFDRAERIYQAMRLRGFEGDFPDEPMDGIKPSDIFYGLFWTFYFLLARWINIPQFLGGLL